MLWNVNISWKNHRLVRMWNIPLSYIFILVFISTLHGKSMAQKLLVNVEWLPQCSQRGKDDTLDTLVASEFLREDLPTLEERQMGASFFLSLECHEYDWLCSTILSSPEMYVDDLKSGRCDGKVAPAILKETAATAYVDGKNGIGMVCRNSLILRPYSFARRPCELHFAWPPNETQKCRNVCG